MESLDHLIEKLGIHLEVPKIEEKELSKATFILIRHAYSDFNFKY
jgi:hypothetical protein